MPRLIKTALLLVSTLAALTALTSQTHADPPALGVSYPRVRTHSGAFYGPTMAHTEYFRRYGHPWHGQGGFTVLSYPASSSFPGCGWWSAPVGWGGGFWGSGFSGRSCISGFGGWGTSWSFPVCQPIVVSPGLGWWSSPYQSWWGWNAGLPSLRPIPPAALAAADLQAALQRGLGEELALQDPVPRGLNNGAPVLPRLQESSAAAQLRSLQRQQQGDQLLSQLEYHRASQRYREAIDAAPERAEPHLHLAIALAGMKDFDEAASELKQGLDLDSDWPQTGRSLVELLGEQNIVGRIQLKQRVAEWTLKDVHDADRLFLLGTLLHLDGERDKAQILLSTAQELVGLRNHLAAFSGQASDPVALGGSSPPVMNPSPFDAMQRPTPPDLVPAPPDPGPQFP